ncbi:MAG: hypothetical protein ACOVSR_14320 [Bacteroidia bacterium]
MNISIDGLQINNVAVECPHCGILGTPILLNAYSKELFNLEIIASAKCPNYDCQEFFYIDYITSIPGMFYTFSSVQSVGTVKPVNFNENIEKISNSFVALYNEANAAENHKLLEICGIAYRKALEFLVKDYLCYREPLLADNIAKDSLGNCIKKFEHPKLKIAAEKATWLGNDEAHYVKKWPDYSVNDLKHLINLVVAWITLEVETENYEKNMNKS